MEDKERERLKKLERLKNSGKQVHPAKTKVRSKIPIAGGIVTEHLPEYFARSPEFRKLFTTIRACLAIKKLSFELISEKVQNQIIAQEEVTGEEGFVFVAPGEDGNELTVKLAKNTSFQILEVSPATQEMLLFFKWGETTFYTRFLRVNGTIMIQPAKNLKKNREIKTLIEFRNVTIGNVFVSEHFDDFKLVDGHFVKRVKDSETIKALQERSNTNDSDYCLIYVHRKSYRSFSREGFKWYEKYLDRREFFNYYHFFLTIDSEKPLQ